MFNTLVVGQNCDELVIDLAAVAALLAAWPADKPKACITVLARNSDLTGVISSVRKLERTFNAAPDRRYPYW